MIMPQPVTSSSGSQTSATSYPVSFAAGIALVVVGIVLLLFLAISVYVIFRVQKSRRSKRNLSKITPSIEGAFPENQPVAIASLPEIRISAAEAQDIPPNATAPEQNNPPYRSPTPETIPKTYDQRHLEASWSSRKIRELEKLQELAKSLAEAQTSPTPSRSQSLKAFDFEQTKPTSLFESKSESTLLSKTLQSNHVVSNELLRPDSASITSISSTDTSILDPARRSSLQVPVQVERPAPRRHNRSQSKDPYQTIRKIQTTDKARKPVSTLFLPTSPPPSTIAPVPPHARTRSQHIAMGTVDDWNVRPGYAVSTYSPSHKRNSSRVSSAPNPRRSGDVRRGSRPVKVASRAGSNGSYRTASGNDDDSDDYYPPIRKTSLEHLQRYYREYENLKLPLDGTLSDESPMEMSISPIAQGLLFPKHQRASAYESAGEKTQMHGGRIAKEKDLGPDDQSQGQTRRKGKRQDSIVSISRVPQIRLTPIIEISQESLRDDEAPLIPTHKHSPKLNRRHQEDD